MNPLQLYRKFGVKVTDFSSQLWCEKQLEFVLKYGRRRTREMKAGSQRHQKLHEEVAELVQVKTFTLEDHVSLKLHNCLACATDLNTEGMTREMPIWGNLNSLFVVGSIDEIVSDGNVVKIIDTKTRRSERMPREEQKLTTRFQLMTYRHLLDIAKKGRFTSKDLLKSYNFDARSKVSKEFKQQAKEIGIKIEPNLMKLSSAVFSMIRECPDVSDSFEVRYEFQGTGSLIGVDEFKLNPQQFKRDCDFLEQFWLGKRDAVPLESGDWRCNYCDFKDRCNNGSSLERFCK